MGVNLPNLVGNWLGSQSQYGDSGKMFDFYVRRKWYGQPGAAWFVGGMVAPAPEGWDEAWIAECEERLAAYDRGEVKADDFDAALSDLRRKYGRA